MRKMDQHFLRGSRFTYILINIQVPGMQDFRVEEPIDQESLKREKPTQSKLKVKCTNKPQVTLIISRLTR